MNKKGQVLARTQTGRDEMNLAEFPLSVIGKRAPGNGERLGAGWLSKAIRSEESFAFRDGYISNQQKIEDRQERTQKQQAAEALLDQADTERVESSRAREKARRKFQKRISRLTETEQEQLEQEALGQAAADGNRILVDRVVAARRSGEALVDAGPIRQQLWEQYVFTAA